PAPAGAAGLPRRTARVGAQAVRPFSFTASIVPVLLGSAIASAQGMFTPGLLALALLGAVGIQGAANLFSDYFDYRGGYDTPESFGGSGVLVRGILQPSEVFLAGLALMAASVAIGLYLTAIRGTPILLLGILGAFGAYFYSGRPIAYKYRAGRSGDLSPVRAAHGAGRLLRAGARGRTGADAVCPPGRLPGDRHPPREQYPGQSVRRPRRRDDGRPRARAGPREGAAVRAARRRVRPGDRRGAGRDVRQVVCAGRAERAAGVGPRPAGAGGAHPARPGAPRRGRRAGPPHLRPAARGGRPAAGGLAGQELDKGAKPPGRRRRRRAEREPRRREPAEPVEPEGGRRHAP